MTQRYDVLLVDDEGPVAAAAAGSLRRRGHAVRTATGLSAALAQEAPDVLVCSTELEDGTGLALVAELRRRGSGVRAILLGRLDGPEELRAALRLGIDELLARPCRLAELVEAVEGGPRAALPTRRSSHAACGHTLQRELRAEPEDVEDALRELVAFLARRGVSPTTRTRAASACAEVLDNVRAHARADLPARAELLAELDARELVVRVEDAGAGVDAVRLREALAGEPREGGLARALALAEDVRVESAPGRGTRVTLRFSAYRVDFDEDQTIDLSELDWLPPALARRVLVSVQGGAAPLYNLSPAMAVTVGRLLAGATVRQRAERALWS